MGGSEAGWMGGCIGKDPGFFGNLPSPLVCVCVCVCDLYFERWILVQRWAGRPIWLRSAEASVER